MYNYVQQEKYINLVLARIKNVKVGERKWNLRCPFCGDSKKNPNKKRGYLFWDNERFCFVYYCHNCSVTKSFTLFLKELCPELYRDYRREIFLEKKEEEERKFIPKTPLPKPKSKPKKSMPLLTRVSELRDSHPAREYLFSRGVPEKRFDCVLWTEKFQTVVENSFPGKYKLDKLPDSGIVFLLYGKDGKSSGFQIRSIDPEIPKSRRFVICSKEGEKGFFGVPRMRLSQEPLFVVEGCIDSLFLPNCIAVLNAGIWRAGLENAVYFSDQERRNGSVCKQIEKCISLGYRTVILPEEYEGMDVNDISRKKGFSEKELVDLFLKNTYSGIGAKMVFARWRNP